MRKTILSIMFLAGLGPVCTRTLAQETMTNQWMVSVSENFTFKGWGTTLSSGWYDSTCYNEVFASIQQIESPTSIDIPLLSLDVLAGYSYALRLLPYRNRTFALYLPVSAYIGYEWVNYRGSVYSSQLSASQISDERLLWGLALGIKAERYLCNHIAITVESGLGYDFGSQVKTIRPVLSVGLRRTI